MFDTSTLPHTTLLACGLTIVSVVYLIGLGSYRLYLHPYANIPGPRLAALTGFYEFYFDIVLRGQYVFHIKELHARYGPIIRICPDEVQIDDLSYWHQLYKSPRRMQKPPKSAYMVGPIPNTFSAVEPELHKLGRAPLAPLFSKAGVAKILPDIQNIVDDLCTRFRDAYKTGEQINLVYAYTALTIDVINEFCFATTYKATLLPDFDKGFHDGSVTYMYTAMLGMQIPGLHENFISWIPPSLLAYMNAAYARILSEHAKWAQQIDDIRTGKDSNHEVTGHDTIFHVLAQSPNLPPHEKTTERLQGEAVVMLNAGTMTTATFLKMVTYFMLSDPSILNRLKTELRTAIPSPRIIPPLSTLKKLEYLSAIVQEGLRMAYGASHRLRRLAIDTDMVYGTHTIPRGYLVSMSPPFMHDNPTVFPNPRTFRPERWLAPERHPDAERAFIPFGSGPRSCLGMNLAYAELYLTTATVFRRFDFAMHGVERARDIDMNHDYFTPMPARNSPGLPVTVTACDW